MDLGHFHSPIPTSWGCEAACSRPWPLWTLECPFRAKKIKATSCFHRKPKVTFLFSNKVFWGWWEAPECFLTSECLIKGIKMSPCFLRKQSSYFFPKWAFWGKALENLLEVTGTQFRLPLENPDGTLPHRLRTHRFYNLWVWIHWYHGPTQTD